MPLVQGSSKAAIEENTKREIAAGKDPKQAYAIANAVARRLKATQSDEAIPPAPVAGSDF